MHQLLKRMICLTVAFVTFFVSFAAADTLTSVSVTAAALSSDKPTLDGMVRVYLSSLGSPTSLTLTVSGSYSLSDGTSLSTGETLYVSFNSATGTITLTRNGTAYSMGTGFTLRRHSTTGSNGIQIAQARKPGNLYPGDLQFKAVSGSAGYKLYTIAHVYMEDYLYGVVPYEMGSSAPLEALKAQAVAARTYTVRMMTARSSWTYDVVDTTGDQTYNGTPTTTSSCNTAVDATKGIVLKNGSAYTATYYSASNGGQTESIKNAWGTTGYDYLGVKDDPFDYANPSSIVKTTTVYANASSSLNNASLLSLLKIKAASALSAAGYSATTTNTTLQTIQSISPHTPMYASPSKLYTKMDFTLTVSTYTAAGAQVAVTTTVTCDIFDDLESLLGMGIQSGDNELWSVQSVSGGFELQARRYGHGIGMSQRGAMYMGQIGYTYDEILGFYYSGSTRVGCTFTNTILAADSSEVITTNENPAETDESVIRGTVTLSGDSQLAVRNAKSSTATVLTVLSNSTSVTVLANDGTWCLIKFGSIAGYVPTSSLTIAGTAPESDDTAVSTVAGFAVVKASGYLNLRQSGSYSASILATAPTGAILTVLAWDEPWASIQYGTVTGYAASDYLTYSAQYPETIDETGIDGSQDDEETDDTGEAPDTETLTAVVATETGSLNMRLLAQAGSTIVTTIPKGATVTVTEKGATWSAVSYLGVSGYVMSQFLTFAQTGTDTAQPDTIAATTAIVTTASGSLNMRSLPQAGSAIYTTIPRMQTIDVVSQGVTWSQVTYNGITGYVMSAFLTFITEENGTDDGSGTDGETDDTDSDTETTTITAIVSTQSGSLNLRAEAQTGSKVLTTIPKGASIIIIEKLDTWSCTSYLGVTGYVMNEYLKFSETASVDTGSTALKAVVSTTSGSLNLRDAPNGSVLTRIPQGTTVTVAQKGDTWSSVTYQGIAGYVMTVYLTFQATDSATDTETGGGDTDSGESGTGAAEILTATVVIDASALNMRTARSTTAGILTAIPNGAAVTVTVRGDSWCKVAYGAYQGYVETTYLMFSESMDDTNTDDSAVIDETETTNEETNDDESTQSTAYSITAWVNTASGSLNLRETASESAAVLAQIPQYAEVKVISDMTQTWCETIYGASTGYVMSAYLTTTEPVPDTGETDAGDGDAAEQTDSGDTASAEPETTQTELPMDSTLHALGSETIVYVRPSAGSSTLGLYEACSANSELLQNMIENSQVEILRAGDTWCEIIYFDQLGYCLRDGLSFFED